MSKGINKVIIIGNVGQNPNISKAQNGSTIVSMSVATTESWIDKYNGQKKEATEWHKICVFNKLAEICEKYVSKGSKVYVEGSLKTRKYIGKDGIEKQTTEIIAATIQILDTRNNKDGNQQPNYQEYSGRPSYNKKQNNFDNTEQQPEFEFDDDIPF
jgi:single-strand DNA-binding protein